MYGVPESISGKGNEVQSEIFLGKNPGQILPSSLLTSGYKHFLGST
jgi:hypothetical protein